MQKLACRLSALVLVSALLCGTMPVANAALVDNVPTRWDGWEDWSPMLYQFTEATVPTIKVYCPTPNATDEEIYYYVGKLLSENLDGTYVYYLYFPQPNWSAADGEAWCKAQDGFLLWREWYFGDAYIKTHAAFSNGELRIKIEPANADSDPELVAKVREIGEAAKAASGTARGQVEYIAAYLGDTVTYGKKGENSEYDFARGALLNGYAVCGGFQDAVSMLCDYLGIPNVEVVNTAVTHGWNTVYIDGMWKHIDTVGSGILHSGVNNERIETDTSVMYMYVDEYDAVQLAAKQTAVLAGWEGITAPYRSMEAVNALTERGILRGDQNGSLNLDGGLTRAELATILTRLSGTEDMVMADTSRYTTLCTFTDVPDWAKPYIGYCVEQGLVNGYNAETYGASDPVTPAAACTVILRHMGYPETDWNYNTAIGKAASVGLVSPYWPTGTVALRADMALLAYASIDK